MNTEEAIVEFVNDAFYLAFNTRDIEKMAEIWSEMYPVVCIHPGWPPLFGREAVLQSWTRIFENQNAQITCHEPHVFSQAGLISVVCYEQMQEGWLIATNNFVMQNGSATMIHHQAGLCPEPPSILTKPQQVQ